MMTDRLMVITVVAYLLGIAAISPALASNTIMTVLNANSDRFSLLVTAIQAAGLTDTLAKETGPFTLFAPTNDAFKALPESTKTKFKADMKTNLLNHAVSGNLPVAKMVSGDLATIGGTPSKVAVSPTGVTIGTAKIVSDGTFTADNGIVHTIDGVLMAP